uniref:PGG domain-containing protein n=1 Tax=Fagus sylvatica TaxID=28930 RepID=A0A2N9EC34_FAGSY
MDERLERMKQAAQEGNIDAFYNLIQEDVNLLEYINELPFVDTPLHIAASAGHISFAMEMMRLKPSFARKPNPDGFSPIHLALQNKEINMVHRLLQVNQDVVRVKGKKGITPLHYAVETDNLDLLATFLSVCPDAIEDVTNQNETALHIALKYDKLDAFKFLVGWLGQNTTKNARIWERTILNWKDEEGNTVLHVAVVRLLLASRYDIDINSKNSNGKTAWDILQEQRQVNKEIKVMLRRARALPASSVPTVTSYANYLRQPKFIFLEKLRKNYIRERTRRLDDNRNALLVVAILLITVTYQGVLSPPGGLWQDDYNPATNQTDNEPATNAFNNPLVRSRAFQISPTSGNQSISQSHEAGTAAFHSQSGLLIHSQRKELME